MYVNTKALQSPHLCKRKGCHYYAKSTKTCDYRIMTGKGRACPIDKCDKFIKRGRRPNPFNKTNKKKKKVTA